MDLEAEARGVAALQCIAASRGSTSAGESSGSLPVSTGPSASASLTTLNAQHFPLTLAVAEALAAAAPCLSALSLSDAPDLSALPALLSNAPFAHTLRSLHLERCSGWPSDVTVLAAPLAGCERLEHLSWVLTDPAAVEVLAAAAAFDDHTPLAGCCSARAADNRQGHGSRRRQPAEPSAAGAGKKEAERLAKANREQRLRQLVAAAQQQYTLGVACAAAALPTLTQLRSLTLDLRLPAYDIGPDTAARDQAAAAGGAAATRLAAGLASLTRLTRLELDEGGSAPHPAWRLELLAAAAALPQLEELNWRRLEMDGEAAAVLAASKSLTVLSAERFIAPAGVKAVALAATAAAVMAQAGAAALAATAGAGAAAGVGAVSSAVSGLHAGGMAAPPPAAALAAVRSAAAAAVVAANAAAVAAFPDAAQEPAAAAQDGTPAPPLWRRLLLPLPPGLRVLRLRYSGLGGMSLAALAALQLPASGLEAFELRNPKLEIGDGDVEGPSGTRLLPQAALALGLGLRKLAAACPLLDTLRIINEARQREALAAPQGWEGQQQGQQAQAPPQGGMGGAGGGAAGAGGGHAPWLAALSGLKALRRLTLSGLKLGSADAEALASSCPALEELHLVPLSSVSSAAVPVLRGMRLRRLTLPYERH
ncbi:hypothetical protein HYH02_002868 [Chlamydomonas schloesseri]|uniref:Uncharacterized protein n=1 Tax=Chlamydomonas schloesseri TaxID=2026947 RepID=A0A836BB64_9CHLO|nr:hypothetical protein HYH02_002868 [Chlamydomonas schloesseri]|eukprot:KAG2452634.1 hypothetical protein HYH02_002868 [Chlamydomonas schloesseri]